jgi:hypothetical protein
MKRPPLKKEVAFLFLRITPAGYLIREVKLTLPVLFGEV